MLFCLKYLLPGVHFFRSPQTGYSKDGRFNEVQVVLAVLANGEGLPVAYELFPGNTSEFGTLREVLNKAINKYKVRKVLSSPFFDPLF